MLQNFLKRLNQQMHNFKSHIKNLCTRVSRVAGASYSLRNTISLSAAKTFYYSMAHSIISYLIVIWGGSKGSYLKELQIAHNRVVRNLFGNNNFNNYRQRTSKLFLEFDILNIESIYKLELAKLMFRMLYENKFPQLNLTLEQLHWRHNYNTRKIDVYRLPNARLNLDHSSTLFSAIKLWNGLPLSIRSH